MLVRSVVDHQLADDAQAAPVRLAQKRLEIPQRTVNRVDARVVGNVVAVVAQGGGIKRQQPESRDPKILEIIQALGQAAKIPDPVPVAVGKAANVDLINDGIFVPERIVLEVSFCSISARSHGNVPAFNSTEDFVLILCHLMAAEPATATFCPLANKLASVLGT